MHQTKRRGNQAIGYKPWAALFYASYQHFKLFGLRLSVLQIADKTGAPLPPVFINLRRNPFSAILRQKMKGKK